MLAGARIDGRAARLDLALVASLTFEQPDLDRFPALALARSALVCGRGAATVLNAANEVAVAEFLGRRLGFAGIPVLVEATLESASHRGFMRADPWRRVIRRPNLVNNRGTLLDDAADKFVYEMRV